MDKVTTPFVRCDKCRDTGGFIYTVDEHGNQVSKKCDCFIEHQKKQELRLRLYKANIPPQMEKYDIATYIGDKSLESVDKLKRYIEKFSEKFNSIHLYLYGPNSTQKTTLSMWVGREIIKTGHTVHYVLMDDLIKSLMQEGFKEEVLSEIKTFENVNCLIVDESFDKDKVNWYKSGYQLSFLDRFLRSRLEQKRKSTIFISNKEVDTIQKEFGESIYRLIERNTMFTRLKFEDNFNKKKNFDPEELWG